MHRTFPVAVLLTLFLPMSASAFELKATYDVDAVALKSAVVGTSLTFSLHTDPACSTPAVSTSAVNVEDVDSIAVLKRFVPKGAAKPPKTARLSHVLANVPLEARYYLSVSGTGVSAVGGSCQMQEAHALASVAAGPPLAPQPVPVMPSTVASVSVDLAEPGATLLLFETFVNGYATDQYIACSFLVGGSLVSAFQMDTGDVDSPTPQADLLQGSHAVVNLAAGTYTVEVECSVPPGPAPWLSFAKVSVVSLPRPI